MMFRRIVRGAAWLVLLALALLQIALPIVSEPYLPLKPGEYQIRRAASDDVAVPPEQHGDVTVLVRCDLLTPIPPWWTGWVTYMALFVLWVVPTLGKVAPSGAS